MDLAELQLNRQLYRTQPQTLETLSADDTASNLTPSPSTAIASGNSVTDVNTNAETINGASITPGTIPASTLDVSNWGWTQTCAFTSASATQVNWGSGSFISANGITYAISAGNTGAMGAKTYIYLDLNVSSTAYQHTTISGNAVGVGKVLVAVAQNAASAATFNLNVATQIVGDNILANTIDASKIVAGSITATQISASYVYAGTISANNITAGSIVGSTLSTATSGQRTDLTTTFVNFYDSGGTNTGSIFGSSSDGGLALYGNTTTSNIVFKCGSAASIIFVRGSTNLVYVNNNGVYPAASSIYDLGNTSFKWRDIWNTGTHVYQGIDQPITYFGYCSGTNITETNSPFSLANPSTGKYTVTHNFGNTNYTVVATTLRGSGAGAYVCKIESRNANDFKVTVFDDLGTVQNGDFMFNLSKIA